MVSKVETGFDSQTNAKASSRSPPSTINHWTFRSPAFQAPARAGPDLQYASALPAFWPSPQQGWPPRQDAAAVIAHSQPAGAIAAGAGAVREGVGPGPGPTVWTAG